jgi:hypothetical protein
MQMPPDYYHCFLGNGLDAVLIGPSGSMSPETIKLERGAWYKSDRYYPEDRLRGVVPSRQPADEPFRTTPEAGWCESAPLGRTWYTVSDDHGELTLERSEQRFVPQEGTLYSDVTFGRDERAVRGRVVTWLHPTLSLLVTRYKFDAPLALDAFMGPGVWLEEGVFTDPFYEVRPMPDEVATWYDLGQTRGLLALRLQGGGPATAHVEGQTHRLRARGTAFTHYFAIFDDRQGPELTTAWLDEAIGRGYDALHAEHLAYWRDYFAASRIEIPDAQFQQFYDAAMYHMKAMQNPVSGGLPVNNLRLTWSSHVFWDAYFLQHALLRANHRAAALESCRFLQRTAPQAARHAREEFGCDGLKWDWEITHEGRKAYGVWLHQKYQIHNTASHANQIWGYYDSTRDAEFLREFYPILEGMARFFMDCVVQERPGGGYEVGYQVGVHESADKVRNDGINVAGTIAILQHCANAARLLGSETPFSRRCAAVAADLRTTLDSLYNGRYFRASEDSDTLNMSSIAPIYPMAVVAASDPRAVATAGAFLERYRGRAVGHGGSESGFPWAAGVLGTVLARQGDGATAWQVIQTARAALCAFGGMAEIVTDGAWNMQYFGTAEGAICTALHQLLLQSAGDTVQLFPARPPEWDEVAFENLLTAGLTVSARYRQGAVQATVSNAGGARTIRLVYGDDAREISLAPGERAALDWPQAVAERGAA